jgi:hypothetical protein
MTQPGTPKRLAPPLAALMNALCWMALITVPPSASAAVETGDTLVCASAFDPRINADWATVAERLEGRFLWLPWNWALLEKRAVLPYAGFLVSSGRRHFRKSPVPLIGR